MTDSCTFQTLAEIVHLFPRRQDCPAIKWFNGFRIQSYSYNELYDLACRCAALFASQGIRRGDRILLWAPNSPEWAVVFCACVISGVVLVPLDVRNPADFVRRIAEECEPRLLIRTQFRRLDQLQCPSWLIETLFARLRETSRLSSHPEIHGDDLAEIIYTSGTTGDPKGVMLSQGNIAANVTDVRIVIPADETYTLLSVLPLSHALEQTGGFWVPLAGGGCVVYMKILKPSAIFEVFQRESITVMVLVPRLLALLRQRIEKTLAEKHLSLYLRAGQALPTWTPRLLRKMFFMPVHRRFNPRFHHFVSGGAALDPTVERFWRNLGFVVLQGYGLTETSPVLTVGRPHAHKIGSVGLPLDRVELRLGEDHEIHARGPNVFSGYFKKSGVTAQVLKEGWFATGDVGEQDADGFLFIRSRKKDIIVTSDGVNVYPEDIERALEQHPGVKEACVLGVGEHEEIIHAVLLLHEGHFELETILEETNRRLSPEQQIDSGSVWRLPEFPKTTTLKIKKREVRQVIQPAIQSGSGSGVEDAVRPAAPPASVAPLQRLLAEIANLEPGEIQPQQTIGQDLGLGSMDRVELITRLEEEFRMDFDDNAVQAETTVAELDALVHRPGGQTGDVHFRRWTRHGFCRAIRFLFEWIILRPLLKGVCDVRVLGLENVQNHPAPLFFVANHTSHVDTALMQTLLPPHLSRRICPAAFKEYFDTEGRSFLVKVGKFFAWNIATICFNIFPFPQSTGYRRSMMYAGELVDEGWNILLFPEGQRSVDGRLADFREGVGMMVPNLNVPVVPVAIQGGEEILPRGAAFPRRGKIKIAFGKPFVPAQGSFAEITEQIKAEILKLLEELDHL